MVYSEAREFLEALDSLEVLVSRPLMQ